ncbi:hypothetical protein FOPE_01252 [Fonsecaea pedrosoi]|nr:hypothetical protein FOPE_01252 [Fonsecaea pedrosoi]
MPSVLAPGAPNRYPPKAPSNGVNHSTLERDGLTRLALMKQNTAGWMGKAIGVNFTANTRKKAGGEFGYGNPNTVPSYFASQQPKTSVLPGMAMSNFAFLRGVGTQPCKHPKNADLVDWGAG